MALNFVQFLQKDCSMFEESFRVLERCIELFSWPHKYEVWLKYLQTMVLRFKDTKVERVRDLFEKCTTSIPVSKPNDSQKGQIPDQGKLLFVMYSSFEEKYGLVSHSVEILEQAI